LFVHDLNTDLYPATTMPISVHNLWTSAVMINNCHVTINCRPVSRLLLVGQYTDQYTDSGHYDGAIVGELQATPPRMLHRQWLELL